MNNVLTDVIANTPPLDTTQLNALHYAAATTLAGVREPKSSSSDTSNVDPDICIKTKVRNTRKWIGRLTAAKRDNKLTHKVKKYLKGKDADVTLHRLTMKLAALSKKLRTKVASRSRHSNNTLFLARTKKLFTRS